MTGQPDQPFRGVEYSSLEQSPAPVDPYPPVDYRSAYLPLPPPVYPQPGYPQPGATGYPSAYPGRYPVYPPTYPGAYPYPPDPYDPYRPAKPPGTNGKAIGALVASLAGLLFCGLPSIAGVILGIIAMGETRRTGQDGYGLALAGTIIGALVVAFVVVYILVVVVIAASGTSHA
jgi:hypothetical protein